MTKPLFQIVLITTVILLISCEGGTTFTKTINNKSSEEITIKVYSIYGNEQSEIINSNESKEIYWDDQMGSFVDDSYSCTQEFDSIQVIVSNDKVLTKDILNSGNWQRESDDERNSKEDCTFTITNNDLQ